METGPEDVSGGPAAVSIRPTLVLIGGLGAPDEVWAPQRSYFADRFRFVHFQFRGLFGAPPPVQRDGWSVPRQVSGLPDVIDAAGASQGEPGGTCVLVGWSGGVQVALEAYPLLRERVRALVLIAGAAGRTFGHLPLRGRLPEAAMTAKGLLSQALLDPVKRRRALYLLGHLAPKGVLPNGVAPELLDRLAAEWATVDPTAYAENLRALMRHDASSLLSEIRVPTLVVHGDRDPVTPIARAHELARNLPRSELCVVRGAGHYVALEYADLCNVRIERFLRDAAVFSRGPDHPGNAGVA